MSGRTFTCSTALAASLSVVWLSSLAVIPATGDIYLSNPRGSNNRLDENNRVRSNGNRLFDSQNNDRGGYNVGSLYYYEGSSLSVEWTAQHSCAGPNNNCQLILQYMCGDDVRDGSTTTTIPDNPGQCVGLNCDVDKRFGMNENSAYYLSCRLRERNKGLFTADQVLKGDSARFTRQNPDGARRGYECPEERDYYPYWQPSPWVDIAVLTSDPGRCPYYRNESQNVKPRWTCWLPANVLQQMAASGGSRLVVPSTEAACTNFTWPLNNPNVTRAIWKAVPAHGSVAPECREAEYSRDNHLGNGLGGHPLVYNWTIPDSFIHENCVLRLRYNISTNDFDSWRPSVNASLNARGSTAPTGVSILSNMENSTQRGYVFKNNPEIQLFPNAPSFSLRLALNTAQYGRVFQDRSHTFAIRRRPDSLKSSRIHNVNVRGRRGNIVQTFPAVEYDFIPQRLVISRGEHLHIQWTGSNTNPNDAGQGLGGTDRSNIVLLANRSLSYSVALGATTGAAELGQLSRNYPSKIFDVGGFLGLSVSDQAALAFLNIGQFRGEMSELDDAGTYFDLGPRQATSTGTYNYMCTRNNNFSNRDQKGQIVVTDFASVAGAIGINGGQLSTINSSFTISVPSGTFSSLQKITLRELPVELGRQNLAKSGQDISIGNDYASSVYEIHPQQLLALPGLSFTVSMKVDPGLGDVKVFALSGPGDTTWADAEDCVVTDGVATFKARGGGVFVARSMSSSGIVAAIVVAVLLVVTVLIVSTAVYFRRHPKKADSFRRRLRWLSRSRAANV